MFTVLLAIAAFGFVAYGAVELATRPRLSAGLYVVIGVVLGLVCLLFAPVANAAPTPVLAKKWAHTGQLIIRVHDHTTPEWRPYLEKAVADWNKGTARTRVRLVIVDKTPSKLCPYVFGVVKVCSGDYGPNKYYGHTAYAGSGEQMMQAAITMNMYYLVRQGAARRQAVMTHELGHALGLNHNDAAMGNANTGSVMDNTNDPTGTKAPYGPKVALEPSEDDFIALTRLYAVPQRTQLAQTRP